MEIVRLAAVQQKISKAKIKATSKLLLQVAFLEDQNPILDWNKINSEETLQDELRVSIPKLSHFFDVAKVKYENKLENTQNEIAKEYAQKSIEAIPLWTGLLVGADGDEYGWKKDPAFLYIAAIAIAGQGLRPDADGLQTLYEWLKGQEPKAGKKPIIKRYKDIVDAIDEGVDADEETGFQNKTGWIEIPGGRDNATANTHEEDVRNVDPKYDSFQERLYLTKKVVDGSGWCLTNQSTRTNYLADGKFMFYIEGGRPKLCLRYYGEGLAEIQGLNNQAINGYLFADQLFELHEKYPELRMDQYRGGLSLDNARVGKEKVMRYNDPDMTVEQLKPLFRGRGDNPFFYLLDSTIMKYWNNPDFVESIRYCLTTMGIVSNVELPMHLSRFPKMKDDASVFDRAVQITKKDFRQVFETGVNTMSTADLVLLNKGFKGAIAKHPEIVPLGEEVNATLLGGDITEEVMDKLVHLDSYLKGNLKENEQIADLANTLAVNALIDGDIDKFQKLQAAFNIAEAEGDIKEQAFVPARREAIRLIVRDPNGFQRLDDFFDKRLSDDMEAILLEAYPQAKEAAVSLINANDYEDFKELDERFNHNLREDVDVYALGRTLARDAMMREDDDKFALLDDAYGGQIENDKEAIVDDVYLALKPKIIKALVSQDLALLQGYNEKLNNRVGRDTNLLNDAFESAVERVTYMLDWGVVKTEEGDWLKDFNSLDKMYQGRLSQDPRVKAQASNLATKSLIYCDPSSPDGCQNPYWRGIMKRLYKSYGNRLITRESLQKFRFEYGQAAKTIAMKSVEKGDTRQAELLLNSYPQLREDPELFNYALKKAERLLSGYFGYDPAVAQIKFNEWDQVFQGTISANPKIQQLLNRQAGSTWYSFYCES